MRTLIKMVVCLIIGVTAVSCSVSSSAIVTDYDREVPFGNYKTFYWSDDFQMDSNKENEPLFFNTLIKKRLKAAIQEQMENMMNNGVNIKRLQEDVKMLREDVEKLKDSNRDIIYKNGTGQ